MEMRLQPTIGCRLAQNSLRDLARSAAKPGQHATQRRDFGWRLATCLLVVGLTVTVASWAQTGSSQGSAAQPPAPKPAVAPPPADLEPGVNTSAIQPSSSDTPAPVTSGKATGVATAPPTPSPRKRGGAGSSAAEASGVAASRTPGPATGGSGTPSSGPSGSVSSASAGAAAAAEASARATPKSGAPGKAHDSIQLDTTQITGNRELPKVLYIVPWKRSDLGDLVGKPVNSLLDEVLTPVDRDVFKRQNRYYDALKPDAAKDSAGAASGPQKP